MGTLLGTLPFPENHRPEDTGKYISWIIPGAWVLAALLGGLSYAAIAGGHGMTCAAFAILTVMMPAMGITQKRSLRTAFGLYHRQDATAEELKMGLGLMITAAGRLLLAGASMVAVTIVAFTKSGVSLHWLNF